MMLLDKKYYHWFCSLHSEYHVGATYITSWMSFTYLKRQHFHFFEKDISWSSDSFADLSQVSDFASPSLSIGSIWKLSVASILATFEFWPLLVRSLCKLLADSNLTASWISSSLTCSESFLSAFAAGSVGTSSGPKEGRWWEKFCGRPA